jgi:hypothetical protein
VTAFQVGFFDGARLVRAIEVPRDSAQLTGSRIRLDIPLIAATDPSRVLWKLKMA